MTETAYISLGGGVDIVKPPRALEPGKAFYAVNYECPITGGYRRIEGYTQIGPVVPGTGPLLGVRTFADNYYAIRGNGDGTASMYIYNNAADAWDLVTGGNGTLNEARHEFVESNVLATNTGRSLYFVGEGRPWALNVDGTLTELLNAPSGAKFIAVHKNHLFLGFEPGSVQFSGPGEPNNWDAATGGAGEIGVSQTLTGLTEGRGDVLHVACRDSMKGIYGSSSANFEVKTTLPSSGCKPYSLQSMMEPFFVAERGITNLQASNDFGDFTPFQAGAAIEPLFTEQGFTTRVVASMRSKERAQYRVFFDDKTGVYYSATGITTVEYPDQIAVTDATELDSGEEVLLLGDEAGKVHRLGNGATSFNGTAIRAFIALAYTDLKAPNVRKRYRRAFFDIGSGTDTTISVKPGFDFGDNQSAGHGRFFLEYELDGGLWGVSDWDAFSWSAPVMANEPVDVAGSGTSINFAIYSESVSVPHVLFGYTLNYEPRRLRRG